MILFINVFFVVLLSWLLILDFKVRDKTAGQIEVIQAKLQHLSPSDTPKSHLSLLLPYSANNPDGTRWADKMRETLLRIKHEARRKSLLTLEEKEIEAANLKKADYGAARKKEVQLFIKLVADDFFFDTKEDGDAETTRHCASMFGVHLISVLEGKEPATKENYKPFPKAKATEIKAIVDRWVNDGCPY